MNARDVEAQAIDGYTVYSHAHISGATMLARALPAGVEDFIGFETRPAVPEVDYRITLGEGVHGLRLVADTLEMVDKDGAPRWRAAPPYIVGADGARTDATLAVDDCAVDGNASAPWGRPVTPPGARTCTVRVTWPDEAVVYPAVLDPRWTTTGAMIAARQDHTATLLSNNKVLVAGGRASNSATAAIASAELFDPATATWAATAAGMIARFSATATQLNTSSNSTASGMVLVAGGINNSASVPTAQFYSASTGLWTTAANLNIARHLHTATLMPNGNVLVAGGMTNTTVLNNAAIYNPTTGMGAWTAVSTTMSSARRSHTATLLSSSNSNFNNKVLVVGGNSGGTTSLTTVQLFDTTALTWSTTTALSPAREGHTATKLANGSVLITGGKNVSTFLGTAQVFTIPTSGTAATWASAGTMNSLRWAHTATLLSTSVLNSGSVLVVGGSNGTNPVTSADLWNGTSTWTATTALATAVQSHTATLLASGAVVIAGGSNTGTASVAAGVVYDPSFALSCTSNSQCATGFCVNGVCCDTACNGGCGACNLSGKVGTCSPIASGTSCRASAGVCDVAETCNGTAVTCPTDGFQPSTTVCRASAGTCDVAEKCTGTSPSCPADGFMASGSVCRASAGTCDLAETCSGTSASCPADGFRPSTTVCRASGGTCDVAEKCTGTSASCPVDGFMASGSVCRAAAGTCDVAETCSGTSASCPVDGFQPSTTVCRATAGVCDAPESCTGASATCPTDTFLSASKVCRPAAGQCDQAENCTGNSTTCPTDISKPNGSACSDGNVCTTADTCQSGACAGGPPMPCVAQDQCHVAGTCSASSGGCSHPTAPEGATCNDGNSATAIDTCRSGTCVGTADPAAVLGFEALGQWSFSTGGTVVGLNSNHTQGSHSLEVAVQSYQPLVSLPMATVGNVGPLVLLDVLAPTAQANEFWTGDVQMFVNAPSVGIFNQYLGIVELTGFPLATWQTLAFQLTSQEVTELGGSYDDLTFTIALNVPPNEMGHYLLDNLRFAQPITPVLLGIATDSAGVTKALFSYATGGSGTVTIPYGPANELSDQNGFIGAPPEFPPTQFVPNPSTPFVASMSGPQLTWTVAGNSATATLGSSQLPVRVGPDGTTSATLPNGTSVPLDSEETSALANTVVATDTSYTTEDQDNDAALIGSGDQPLGPTATGSIPGSFRVTDDGAAEYVLKIATPKGRHGVEPNLSLVYDSRAGEGILGPGWSLNGVGRITRCAIPYSVANERGQDPSPISYTDADDFCLDGQRLASIGPNEYRLKNDVGIRIIATGHDSQGPTTFQAFLKNGLIEVYGLDDQSRSAAVQMTQAADGLSADETVVPVRAAWYLAQRMDRFGNEMDVSYSHTVIASPSTVSSLIPQTITYTTNKKTGRAATNSVSFNWHLTPGLAIPKFQAGVQTANNAQLSSITIRAPNPVATSVIGTYKLSYDTPSITQRPLLSRIQRCDGAGVCLEPTVFTWSRGSYNFQKFETPINNLFRSDPTDVDEGAPHMLSGDIDGDGLSDVLYMSGGFFGPGNAATPIPTLWVALGTHAGLAAPSDTGLYTSQTLALGSNRAQLPTGPFTLPALAGLMPTGMADINNDGLADLVIIGSTLPPATETSNPAQWVRFQGNGDGTFARLPLGLPDAQMGNPALNPDAVSIGNLALTYLNVPYFAGDLNGDGLLDVANALSPFPFGPTTLPGSGGICVNSPDVGSELTVGAQLAIAMNINGVTGPFSTIPGGVQYGPMNIGCGVNPPPNTGGTVSGPPLPDLVNAIRIFTADVDGDGRSEIVMSQVGSDGTSLSPTGIGIHAGVNGISKIQTNVPADSATVKMLLDFNGDGLVDFIRAQNRTVGDSVVLSAVDIWENTGKGFQQLSLPSWVAAFDFQDAQVADINGDGMDDVFIGSCPKGGTSNASSPNALISNGFGDFTQVTMTDISLGAALPVPDFVDPVLSGRCNFILLDMNGDGQLDLVQAEDGKPNLQGYLRQGPTADRLVGVTNGLGADVEIQYSRSGDPRGSACGYPYACSGRNVEVVSGYTVDNGLVLAGDPTTTHYTMSYAGPRADASGAGWLGFDRITRQNDQTLNTDTKTYDLVTRIGGWYPFVGQPTNVSIEYNLSGVGRKILRARTIGYETLQSDPNNLTGPYTVVPQTILEQEFERTFSGVYDQAHPQRSSHQTFGYDGLGNVTSHETINDLAGTDDVVTNSVTNDATNWLLNQVNSTTVKSTGTNGQVDQRSSSFQIDPATGTTTGETVNPGDPLQLTVTYQLNGDGLPTKVTEAATSGEVRTQQIGYDPIEGMWPASYTNALGQVSRSVYHDGLGVMVRSTDANGLSTQWTIDGFGRTKERLDPTGRSTFFIYGRPDTSLGSIVASTDSTGRVVKVEDDELGREILRLGTAFDGVNSLAITTFYDAASGNAAFVSRPFTAPPVGPATSPSGLGSRFVFDEMRRTTAVTPPGEDSRTITYQGLRATEFINGVERGYRTTDAASRTVLSVGIEPTSTAPNHEVRTTYDYGAFGQMAHVYLPGGGTVTLDHDHSGRRNELDDPDSGSHVTTYNAFGETMVEQSSGQTDVVHTRDLLGRITSTTQGSETATFQWDTAQYGVGKLDSESTSSGISKSFMYQPNGLAQTWTWTVDNQQFAFDWSYDGSGRAQTITYPDTGTGSRLAVRVGYGMDGLLASVASPVPGTTYWQKTATQPDGRSLTEAFGDGLDTLYQEDPETGRMSHITTGVGPGLAPVAQVLSYEYNPDGTLQTRSDGVLEASEGFTYDNLRRVKTWTKGDGSAVTYGYSDSGNLTIRSLAGSGGTTNETFVYGEHGAGPHAVTTGPTGSYGYDLSGRQVARPGQPTLAYTYFDLPTQVTNSDGSTVGVAYDAEGVRVKKTSATGEILSLGQYERRTQSGTVTHVFYLPGPARAIGQIECDGAGNCAAPLYFHPDRLGTVDTVTQNGVAIGHEKRDPFGRTYASGAAEVGADVTTQFDGMSADADLGLVNMNHRLYDPMTGRFISPDPLVTSAMDGQALNRYSFVGNNPMSFIDPTGLEASDADPGAGAEFSQETLMVMQAGATEIQAGPDAGWTLVGLEKLSDGLAPTFDGRAMAQEFPGATVLTSPDGHSLMVSNVDGYRITVTPSGPPTFLPSQVDDPEVPGGGPAFGSSPVNTPFEEPPFAEMAINATVKFIAKPLNVLAGLSGPNAQTFDLNLVRPFPYSPNQMAVGEATENELDHILAFGVGAATLGAGVAPDAALAATEAANLSTDVGEVATTVTSEATDPLVTVVHFSTEETASAIGHYGTANAGSFVTFPTEVGGLSQGEIESALEIDPGKGAMSTVFQTPASNLGPAVNGPFTSGWASQFQLVDPTPVGEWVRTAGQFTSDR